MKTEGPGGGTLLKPSQHQVSQSRHRVLQPRWQQQYQVWRTAHHQCSQSPKDHCTLNLRDKQQDTFHSKCQQLCEAEHEAAPASRGRAAGQEGLHGLHSHLGAMLPPTLLQSSAPTTLIQKRENLQQSQQVRCTHTRLQTVQPVV